MMQYAIFARPVVTIYDLPQTTKQSEAGLVSTIGDEGLYGQACQVRTAPGGVTAEGVPLSPEVALAHTGWAKVALLDGRTGYVRDVALEPVRFEMTAVFSQREGLAFDDALAEARNITAGELVPQALQAWYDGSEEAFRDAVCAQAKKYLGTEYRWGGKSGRGIDCSGLVSSAYMQCGVLIYRDARIVEGWPMHQIPFADKKRGDALYFPGHIALYLGEGRYIHSTGASASGGVVINSLDPADPLYREDLVKSLYAVGSVF